MKTNICHIFFIRFNYKDLEKLKTRIKLFENYCLPSILNQINKNFKVVLMVNLEEPYISLVRKYSEHKNMRYLTNNYLHQ